MTFSLNAMEADRPAITVVYPFDSSRGESGPLLLLEGLIHQLGQTFECHLLVIVGPRDSDPDSVVERLRNGPSKTVNVRETRAPSKLNRWISTLLRGTYPTSGVGDLDLAMVSRADSAPASSRLTVLFGFEAEHLATTAPGPTVLVAYDAFSRRYLRAARESRGLKGRARYAGRATAFLNVERRRYSRHAAVIAVGEPDTRYLRRVDKASIVHPTGILYDESRVAELRRHRNLGSPTGTTVLGNFTADHVLGSLHRLRVADSLRGVPWTLWGRGAEGAQSKVAMDHDNVEVLEWADSYVDALTRNRVLVYPQLACSGIQTKLLDACLAGRVVIAGRAALEPIGLEHGAHALAADTADELREALHRLSREPSLGPRLSAAAESWVAELMTEMRTRTWQDELGPAISRSTAGEP